METHFPVHQRNDPRMREAESILRRCVHCGLCTAFCPTYVLTGDERDSPRGRIYLIKSMFEGEEQAGPELRTHLDRCLTCLSCTAACPGGVDYMHLADLARFHMETALPRSARERYVRRMLLSIVPSPERFRRALGWAKFARPFRGLLKRFGMKEVAAMLELAPRSLPRPATYEAPRLITSNAARRRGRVIVMTGCAQSVLRPQINDASIRLLKSQGFDVILAKDEGCCGALAMHLGQEDEVRAAARRNVDAWWPLAAEGSIGAIIINASGCGTMVKDYGHLLADDPVYAAKAATVAGLAKDVTEYLAAVGMDAALRWSDLKVVYHGACSLEHGQHVSSDPRLLLRQAGYTVAEIPEGHICCGSAGAYNILQPEIAGELRERKAANIASVRADCVAAGNVGCMTHLAPALDIPIVHTVELLDWAHGGPCPEELRHLEGRSHSVRQAFQDVLARKRVMAPAE